MNLIELQKKLIAAARLQAPDDRVPYAFEKRIMAHIAARVGSDRWVFWARSLWRAAGVCVAVATVCGAVFVVLPAPAPDNNNIKDLSQDFENTLLASLDQTDNPKP